MACLIKRQRPGSRSRSTARLAGLGALGASCLALLIGVSGTAAAVPAGVPAPPGPNPDDRAYEMVTPADKNNRKYGGLTSPELDADQVVQPAVVAPSGNRLLGFSRTSVLDAEGITAGWSADHVEFTRDGTTGWHVRSVTDIPPVGATAMNFSLSGPTGFSLELGTQTWWHASYLFPSRSRYSTKVRGSTAGYKGSSWFDWWPSDSLVDPAGDIRGLADDRVRVADDGSTVVRWGEWPGLLGPDDPSAAQTSGQALYLQSPPGTGPRVVVHECTDAGGPTEIPARIGTGSADDLIGTQPCGPGSVTSAGGARGSAGGIGSVSERILSVDGRTLFFTSPDDPGGAALTCTTATGEDTSCPSQLYLRRTDAQGGSPRVRWISRPEDALGSQEIGLLGPAIYEGASADGRVVYFRSTSPLTADDPNGTGSAPVTEGAASASSWDLYRYDVPAAPADPGAGQLTRITAGNDGDEDPGLAGSAPAARHISDDGRRVYLATVNLLTGADNSRPEGAATDPAPGGTEALNLYLYDAEKAGAARWKFITQIPANLTGALGTRLDDCAGLGLVTEAGVLEVQGQGTINPMHVRRQVSCVRGTSSGDAIAFMSTGQLTVDDDDSAGDIFVYDADTDTLSRVSTPPSGATSYVCNWKVGLDWVPLDTCNADLGVTVYSQPSRGMRGYRNYNLAEDQDGGLVAVYFESRIPFSEYDGNTDRMDVYEWSRASGQLRLLTPGGDRNAWYSGNSLDGKSVFFDTSLRIDPREIDDDDHDLYVARAGGGFPLPAPSPPRCDVVGGGCQPAIESPPSSAGVTSSSLRGSGNASPRPAARRCVGPNRQAKRALRKARRLSKRTRRASGRRALRLRRQARVARRRAVRAQRQARRCGARASRATNSKRRARS